MIISMLIVENDPMVADLHKRCAASVPGFEIIDVVATGAGAVRAIRARRPDLALLDVYLPDMDGVKVLREIRRLNLPTDVIIVTAARDTATIRQVFRFGAVDYIIKPFKPVRLVSALNSYEALRNSLNRRSSFDQEALDHLALGKPIHNRQGRLPKGLHEVTLQRVWSYLRQQDRPLSAEDVASGTGLARVTARRYLEYLGKSGKAVIELQYGSVGRPVNRYRLCDHKD